MLRGFDVDRCLLKLRTHRVSDELRAHEGARMGRPLVAWVASGAVDADEARARFDCAEQRRSQAVDQLRSLQADIEELQSKRGELSQAVQELQARLSRGQQAEMHRDQELIQAPSKGGDDAATLKQALARTTSELVALRSKLANEREGHGLKARELSGSSEQIAVLQAQLEKAQEEAALHDAISELPDGLRQVFVLRHLEGVSCAEVAELLQISESNVSVRAHRARAQVRQTLETWRVVGPKEETP